MKFFRTHHIKRWKNSYQNYSVMRILVSDTLKKDIEKLFHSENILSIFLAKISKVNPEKIYLKRPYVKIKITIFSYTLRVIARYIPENSLLIPLFILEKKNKRF